MCRGVHVAAGVPRCTDPASPTLAHLVPGCACADSRSGTLWPPRETCALRALQKDVSLLPTAGGKSDTSFWSARRAHVSRGGHKVPERESAQAQPGTRCASVGDAGSVHRGTPAATCTPRHIANLRAGTTRSEDQSRHDQSRSCGCTSDLE